MLTRQFLGLIEHRGNKIKTVRYPEVPQGGAFFQCVQAKAPLPQMGTWLRH